jgi:uncharacterized protein
VNDIEKWESLFRSKISDIATNEDPAHDLSHFERVVSAAKLLCEIESGDFEVVIPAAWLHDLVIVPKNDPRRSQASRLSADEARRFLKDIGYLADREDQETKLNSIAHAIEAHSFSAAIEPRSLEAKIVQDADRLDGLGAIGIARLFITAGLMKRPIYSDQDPFCYVRAVDDQKFTIDHVFKKLFVVAESLQTSSGRKEGLRRTNYIRGYLNQLESEL